MTNCSVFLVWEGVGKWVGRCKGCYGKVVTGKPAAYEAVTKRAKDHEDGKPVRKPAKKAAARKVPAKKAA